MDSAWSQNVCVHCEEPIVGEGTYCSQSCRLANLETSSCTSSKTPTPVASSSSNNTSFYPRHTGFSLPPALDFSSSRVGSQSLNLTGRQTYTQSTYFPSPFPGNVNSSRFTPPPRVLTPSTSRSSLSSVSSTSSQCSHLSDQARKELRSYSNSFDLIRNWKRRMAAN